MLSILIVSWNTCALLRRCLQSIVAVRGALALEVIVVDNGSHDGTPAMVRREFPWVTLLEPGENLGFSGGNNLALALAQGDFLLLLNPDTELMGEALPILLAFLEGQPTAGVVGPTLVYGDGSHQPSRHRLPSALTLALASTPLAPHAAPLLRGYYMADQATDVAQPVGWLSGAALLVRREVYEQVGGLDDRFFMYFEETDWQRRIKGAGWAIWYVPTATIRHFEDAASGQVVGLRHARFNRSRLRYAQKWHGARVAGPLRLWLLALYGGQWLQEAVKWLIGHKRPLRAQRLGEYRLLLHTLAQPGR